jgi:succinoglycan biosynthesis transport protein ExoP
LSLAAALSHSGKRVLFVDAHLPSPRMPGRRRVSDELGFVDAARGRTTLAEAAVRIAASPISWLPLGTDLPQTWPSAAELHRVLSTQAAGFDVVIIDGDSVRSSLLSATLTDIVGHIVVCVDEGSTGLSEVEAELDAIGPQGGRLRGLTIAGT